MSGQTNKLVCDTCGAEVESLRRDVVDAEYNAITKPVLWNCEDCYQKKRARRHRSAAEDGDN